jgi:DNA-binding MarR family transcriptional regulator
LNNNEHSIGRYLSILYRYGQSYVSKKLETYNIGSGQYVLLLTLFRNKGVSQEELSEYLKIDKATTAKSIKKLEEDGYISRDIDLDDKRAYKVFLTQKGLDIIPIVQEAIKSWENILAMDLSENENILVEQLLNKMAKNAYDAKENYEENEK